MNTTWNAHHIITDNELAELGYKRDEIHLMNALDIECEVISLRKKKMGLQNGDMLHHVKYMEVYQPSQVKMFLEYLYGYTMAPIKEIKE